MMKIAFYKGTKTGLAGVYNRGVRWIEAGEYSHCELIFSDGISASSSFMDGGVRFKEIDYSLEKWDIIDIPWADEARARKYFEVRAGKVKYNLRGNIHFIFGFIRGNTDGEFCSEACAGALGFNNPWQFPPNQLRNIIVLINERYEMLNTTNRVDEDGGTGHGDVPPPPPKDPKKPSEG
mgnify:CR=1 FL=1